MFNINESPCHKCENRSLHCHSRCDKYKDYKQKLYEINEKKAKENEITTFTYSLKEPLHKIERRRLKTNSGRKGYK